MSPFRRQIPKERIGQVLIRSGIITAEQLEEALKTQKDQGSLIGEILIKLGFATEEDITQALAIQYDFPYLPLANYEIDSEVVKLIPENLARKLYLLPIDKMGDIITVVMSNPLDAEAISQIEALTKCKTEIFVATYTEIKEAIERCYGQSTQGGESKNG